MNKGAPRVRIFIMKPFRAFLFGSLLASLGLAAPTAAQSVDSFADAVAKFDVPPRPLKTKPPRYPVSMRAEGVAGAVVVRLIIENNGKVIAAEVIKASRDEFREPALEAVREWTFQPAQVGGKAVRARVNVPLTFSVNDD